MTANQPLLDARQPTTAQRARVEQLTAMGGYGLPVPNVAEFGVVDPQVEVRSGTSGPDRHRGAESPLAWLVDDRQRGLPFIETML